MFGNDDRKLSGDDSKFVEKDVEYWRSEDSKLVPTVGDSGIDELEVIEDDDR